ncbi:lysozyme inhibitor LprI family protein [Vibrio ichthyoenteri]|uniref:lysozyme inhibitor LprI family protein n=1 Tax=Vibrio ichthyoenteri TaxID=142461 RepID=UPI000587495D|nr:lysozyme inhibitor LprI family protein [Vibrio ichthyoenteri]
MITIAPRRRADNLFLSANLFFFSSLLLFNNLAYAASFDCTQASTSVEKRICSDDDLSALDSQLQTHYQRYLALAKEAQPQHGNLSQQIDLTQQIKQQQREWLKTRNQQCSSLYRCMNSYSQRIVTLKQLADQQGLLNQLATITDSNQLIWLKEFALLRDDFFAAYTSQLLGKKRRLTSKEFTALMSGPPQAYQDNGEVVIAMSCRQHSCPEKGVVAIDKSTTNKSTTNKSKAAMVFAAVHYTDEMGNSQIDKPTLTFYYRDPALFERVKAEILAVVAEHVTVVQVNEVLVSANEREEL